MLSEEQVLEQFCKRGIVSANELYLEISQAFDFVNICYKNNLAVIGIEGFIYREGILIPQLDIIADFSLENNTDLFSNKEHTWQKYRENCHKWSLEFLTSLGTKDGLVLSFVVFS